MIFHAHIYFDPETLPQAVALREEIGRRFGLRLGRVHEKNVGPHTKGMFQVVFNENDFAAFAAWLMVNRKGLDILIHPETGNDLLDHTDHAMWLGAPLAIDVSAFD
jgi:aromatic ring-cleaving dioxygenase